jgi:hypothetical protein
MYHPRVTRDFEAEMLELIDHQDEFTRSDLQGIVPGVPIANGQ